MTSTIHCDSLWHGADIVTMRAGKYHLIRNGTIAVNRGQIVWLGETSTAPTLHAAKSVNFAGGILTPGLIDCHTHLIFAANRSHEFEQRLKGVSYAEIAANGGGILATVNATREASEQQLYTQAAARLQYWLAEGVTCIEIKSGYGLTLESELKMLRVARQLAEHFPIEIKTTCLAAHALPPEYEGRADEYIDLICHTIIPEVASANLADAVDAFCEYLAFSPAQIEKVFIAAEQAGLAVKLHAEQLSSLGGSTLAAHHYALSADHLEYTTEQDIKAMARSGTTAVLLPGAYYMLRETQCPPVALFRKYGVPMAIASDANPGTSATLSLRLMMNMACTLFALTPEEALAGTTIHAAQALGIQNSQGSLEIGKFANFIHWPLSDPAELAYWFGGQMPCRVIYRGEER